MPTLRKKLIRRCLIVGLFCLNQPAVAQDGLDLVQKDMAYADVKASLIQHGWQPFKNLQIEQSSLYALEVYEQGYTEVVDCISMALDGCTFKFTRKNRLLEINTITRQLLVVSHAVKKQ